MDTFERVHSWPKRVLIKFPALIISELKQGQNKREGFRDRPVVEVNGKDDQLPN
jgi:hypothetical protein